LQLYLLVSNALTGNGVHIVTVNDYLANRDQVSVKFIGFGLRYRINSRWHVNFGKKRKL
jgi:hypothetical protein